MDTAFGSGACTGVGKAWGSATSTGTNFAVCALCTAVGFLSMVFTTFRTGNDITPCNLERADSLDALSFTGVFPHRLKEWQ
eukprot:2736585-Amphidinium_carterae.1